MTFPIKILPALLSGIKGILGSVIADPNEKVEAELAIGSLVMEQMSQVEESWRQELQSRERVIRAEAEGGSWMQRNWRPILMLSITGILINNFVLTMYVPGAMYIEIPDRMWGLLQLGVTGYIVGRTAEKKGEDWIKAFKSNGTSS